jgi:hypothetical protein
LVYLLSVGDRADGVVAPEAEGSDPRDGTVPFEGEEVIPGAGDDTPVVDDERARQGTGDPGWRTSCHGEQPSASFAGTDR